MHNPREKGDPKKHLVDRYLGIPLVFLAGALRSKRSISTVALAERSPQIGLMCMGGIGDLVLASALLGDLRRSYPDSRLVVLTSSGNAGLVPVIEMADGSAVLAVGNLGQNRAVYRSVSLDLLIDAGHRARISAVSAALSGAGFLIGFQTPGQHRHYPFDAAVLHRNDVHQLDNYRSLLIPLGIRASTLPRLRVSALVVQAARARVQSDYAVFHPWPSGVRRELKEWPIDRWAKLAQVAAARKLRVVVTGGPEDMERSRNLIATFPEGTGVSVAGELDLTHIVGLLTASRCVVSVNTGIMHLAATVGAPTIALHGPTDPMRWGPIGPRTHVVTPIGVTFGYLDLGYEYPKDPPKSMEGISVPHVAAELEAVLAEPDWRVPTST